MDSTSCTASGLTRYGDVDEDWRKIRNDYGTEPMKAIVLGNCQAGMMANLLQAMAADMVATGVHLSPEQVNRLKSEEIDVSELIDGYDLVFVNLHERGMVVPLIEKQRPDVLPKVRIVPSIDYIGFHPDAVYVSNSQGGNILGPMGGYQSSLAFYGWQNHLDEVETRRLFAGHIYEALGFHEYGIPSAEALIKSEKITGVSLRQLISKWSKAGCWMHSINHPKSYVLADIASALLTSEGIPVIPEGEQYVHDYLADGPVFPVYPEIAARLGIKGQYLFKCDRRTSPPERPVSFLNLEEFIEKSFAVFEKYSRETLSCSRVSSERYRDLKDIRAKRPIDASVVVSVNPIGGSAPNGHIVGNPYKALPDFHFWRRSIELLPAAQVDPIVRTGFKLGRSDKVATAGSCFAQHISRTLMRRGFNYYVAERGEQVGAVDELQSRNFGVFSARYGNLYTTRQLLQLFDRAYETFAPTEGVWTMANGRFADPFRPQIEPGGFASILEVQISRSEHLMAVRTMFEQLEVFVFTLGLTEAWRNRLDGAVYPIAPGVVGTNLNPDLHEFVNFGVADVIGDMQSFIDRLRKVNTGAKIILTISPVPLIATYEDRHVLVANTYSKAVLRVAADEICRNNAMVDYFPSFEIITGHHSRGAYFDGDLRSIRPAGVERVMDVFLKHYASQAQDASLERQLMREHDELNDVICDEEAVDPRTSSGSH
jgi:hypothetical protein